MNSDPLQILGSDANHLRASWHNLYIVVWRRAITLDAIEATNSDADRLLEKYPQGIGWCAVIDEESTIAGPQERERGKQTFDRLGTRLRFAVAIPQGKGLRSVTMRTLLTAFQMLMPPIYQQKIFSSPAEASGWLVERLNEVTPAIAADQKDLAAAFEKIRLSQSAAPIADSQEQKGLGGLLSFLRPSRKD